MNINEVTMKDFNFGDVSGSEESQEPKFQDLFYDEDSKIENQVNSKKKFIIYTFLLPEIFANFFSERCSVIGTIPITGPVLSPNNAKVLKI